MASSLAADFRRARVSLLRTAFRFGKAGLGFRERFPFSPVTFVPDNEGKYTEVQEKSRAFSRTKNRLSTSKRKLLLDKRDGGA